MVRDWSNAQTLVAWWQPSHLSASVERADYVKAVHAFCDDPVILQTGFHYNILLYRSLPLPRSSKSRVEGLMMYEGHLDLRLVVTGLFLLPTFYILYGIIWNLFLHPLRRYPGPVQWAATRIPWCYHQCRGRLPQTLLALHIQYGHVVRIGPNELSYTDETAWKTIYGQRKDEMSKDPIFRLHTPTGAQNILVAERSTHSRQRRLLSYAFSESALREQEAILQMYADKLMNQLSEIYAVSSDSTVDMASWLTFSTFDLIGHMAFGENFGCLDRGEYAPFVRSMNSMAEELVYIQIWKYWKVFSLRRLFTPASVLGQRKQNIGVAMQMVTRRIKNGSEHRDFLHYILSANDESKSMTPDEIDVNAFSLNIAGSESTATALTGALFLILRSQKVLHRLVEEIRSSFQDQIEITLTSTLALTYLDAVITETLRVYPPVAISMPRCVPKGGEAIAGHFVPEATTVGVPLFAMFHHPDHFRRADEFLPERWVGSTGEFAVDHHEALQPFSFGPRGCLGKNIAKAEMRLLFAKLLFTFDFELLHGQEEWLSQQNFGFWKKYPLYCKITPAKTLGER